MRIICCQNVNAMSLMMQHIDGGSAAAARTEERVLLERYGVVQDLRTAA